MRRAAEAGKQTLVFLWHDFDEPVRRTGAIVFRTGFEGRRPGRNEYLYPCWSEDFIERYRGGALPIRQWRERPVVSFCGRADRSPASIPARVVEHARGIKRRITSVREVYPYRQLRARCMDTLARDDDLETRFVVSGGFWGRSLDSSRPVDVAEKIKARRNFVDNMVDSDYVLCPRGAGNFSIRFYETLCCGRVPILMDTEAPLLFEDKINWDRYIIRIRPAELKHLPARIHAFNRIHSGPQFETLQREIREIWETYVEPNGFFGQVHDLLRPLVGQAAQRVVSCSA
jgi:hypothetical protein